MFESFGHDELTAKHCYFRCSRTPDIDGIKIFDKDDQAAQHCSFLFYLIILLFYLSYLIVLRPSYLYQKF